MNIDSVTGARSSDVYAIPVGGAGALTLVATFGESISATMRGGVVLVTQTTDVTSGGKTTEYLATEIVTPTGNVLQPLTSQSAFVGGNLNMAIQVKGIGSTAKSSGGTINQVSLNAASGPLLAPYTNTDGTAYQLPNFSLPFLLGWSNGLGVAGAKDSNGTYSVILDPSHLIVVPISMHNTDISIPAAPYFNNLQ